MVEAMTWSKGKRAMTHLLERQDSLKALTPPVCLSVFDECS